MRTFYSLLKTLFFNVIGLIEMRRYQVSHRNTRCSPSGRRLVHGLSFLIACLFFSNSSMGQTATNPTYTRSYLNNVVDIGLSDYGLITAEDTANLYFIAVRRSQFSKDAFPEKISNTIKQVKFFGGAHLAKATKVMQLPFGAFTVVLYKSPLPKTQFHWQRNYYFALSHKKGKFSTFRDKWLSDKIWSVQEGKISVGKALKNGVYNLNVPLDAGIAKGMPLINSEGFIAGMFAEPTLGKTVAKIINMKDIADALYIAGRNSCKYFNMIEWGKTDMRCILEYNAKIEAEEKAKLEAEANAKKLLDKNKKPENEPKDSTLKVAKATKTPKKHFLDYGINANLSTMPGMDNSNGKDNYLKTRAFHVGISLHLNIDKQSKNRITLKPRYGNFYERKDAGLWVSADNNVSIASTSYQYAEMPIVLERQLFKGKNFSVALGAGYAPGWIFSHKYTWYDKTATFKESITSPNTILSHRLMAELYLYEFKFGRIGFVYTKDMTGYPNTDYKLSVNGIDYMPFESREKAWFVGVELGIRLRGGWGK